MKTVFLRVLDAKDKASALQAAIRGDGEGAATHRFYVDPREFTIVPRSPFAYWVSSSLLNLFNAAQRFEAPARTAKQGLATGNDGRFLRVWWEVDDSSRASVMGWANLVKGGSANAFHADFASAVKWYRDGAELKAFASAYRASRGWGDQWSAMINATEFYFRPGFTWPLRAATFAPAVMPADCAFSTRGCAVLAPTEDLLWLIALTSSRAFDVLFKMLLGRFGHPEFTSGALQEMPLPDLTPADQAALAACARRAWSLKRGLDTRTETSHVFVLPALGQVEGMTVVDRALAWRDHVRAVEAELTTIQAEIDERCFALYGIDEEDRLAITEGFGVGSGGSEVSGDEAGRDTEAEDEREPETGGSTATLAAELMSWAVGVAFGRFDVRLATGDRTLPKEPEPFDPLPICSPAMLTGDGGLPLARPPAGYPLSFPDDGILVDDPGHPRDLTAAVRTVFEAVFGSLADAFWQEAAALLDPRDHDLRRWLASGFFEHHLRRHSKSRRKAPILWQLSIPSGRYSVWCCAHRMTRDSLFAAQNEVVAPKLAHEERRLSSLVTQAGHTPSARDRAEIATQEAVVDELRTLAEEVKRVAPLWNPDLDDGILLVMAPLWRLVPSHKAWQKELKARWDELVAGKYDWAQLAMHLWPERVIPKCATDRSLAIAHSLEDVFWVEGADGKWIRQPFPTRPIDELVIERTSPAVKASLASLLEAPAQAGSAGRRRRNAGVIV